MKYANLSLDINKGMENIGDWAQIFAIERLYHYMNIDCQKIIKIKISEISSYNGEYVILPINYPLYGYYNLSPKIIPVYLGISIIHNSDNGIEAYITGCLTITMPKRSISKKQKKVFIVDVTENVYERIPYEIRKSAIRMTHIYYKEECRGEEGARAIYKLYEEEASLIITSRIHCAQPCLAMGIPVVFICETCSFRYDVLRQYIPIYMLDRMDQIDWNPVVPDLEAHKKRLLQNAADRVKERWKKYKDICNIGDFYLEGTPVINEVDSVWAFQKYILERWKNSDCFYYSVWGITQIAESIFTWIQREYPNAVLDKVIDSIKNDLFHGIQPETPEGLENCKSVVFVTAGSVNPIAVQVFKRYDVKNYVICYNGRYIVNGEENIY